MLREAVKCKVSEEKFNTIIELAQLQGYRGWDYSSLTKRKHMDYFEHLILTYNRRYEGSNYNNGYNGGYYESGDITGYNFIKMWDDYDAREVDEDTLIKMLEEGYKEYLENKAVDYLAKQLKQHFAEHRKREYDWTKCDKNILLDGLQQSINNGNPVDVASYCTLLLARNDIANNTDNGLSKVGETVELQNLKPLELEKFKEGERVVVYEIWGNTVLINSEKYFSQFDLSQVKRLII